MKLQACTSELASCSAQFAVCINTAHAIHVHDGNRSSAIYYMHYIDPLASCPKITLDLLSNKLEQIMSTMRCSLLLIRHTRSLGVSRLNVPSSDILLLQRESH